MAVAASSFTSKTIYKRTLFKTDYLVVLIKPEEGQIRNSNRLPMIRYLFACTIYNMGDFIGYYKFEILHRTTAFIVSLNNYLSSEFITNKKTILNFNGSDHIIVEHLLLLLLLLLLLADSRMLLQLLLWRLMLLLLL